MTYNLPMPRVLYTAFDIVPSPKGASTHILHNIRGLVNSQFDVHLFTPNDGVLPAEDFIEGARAMSKFIWQEAQIKLLKVYENYWLEIV